MRRPNCRPAPESIVRQWRYTTVHCPMGPAVILNIFFDHDNLHAKVRLVSKSLIFGTGPLNHQFRRFTPRSRHYITDYPLAWCAPYITPQDGGFKPAA